jgi:hypothetical protein
MLDVEARKMTHHFTATFAGHRNHGTGRRPARNLHWNHLTWTCIRRAGMAFPPPFFADFPTAEMQTK